MKEKKVSDYKTNITVSRNIRVIKAHLKDLESMKDDPESYKAFEKAAAELAKNHAKKDKEGRPIMVPTQQGSRYDFEDEEAFAEAYSLLMTEHQDAIDEREQGYKNYAEALKAEADVVIHSIKEDVVKKYLSSEGAIIDNIYDIIEWEEEEEKPVKKKTSSRK